MPLEQVRGRVRVRWRMAPLGDADWVMLGTLVGSVLSVVLVRALA